MRFTIGIAGIAVVLMFSASIRAAENAHAGRDVDY